MSEGIGRVKKWIEVKAISVVHVLLSLRQVIAVLRLGYVILMDRGFASSTFGSVRESTPSAISAPILF